MCEDTFELIASAFCLSSLIMFPAILRSPIPWLSCLSLEMKLQNAFVLSVIVVVRN